MNITKRRLAILCVALALDQSTNCMAFAGGFGKAASSSKVGKKKKAETKRKPQRLDEFRKEDKSGPSAPSTKLDKWGLPEPTIDDIFPPLPSTVELRPVKTPDASKQDMVDALSDHMKLDLSGFDKDGVEILEVTDSTGCKPMKLRLLHQSPPVLVIENFFTPQDCLDTEAVALESESDDNPHAIRIESKTFSPLAQSKRTSTSWFCQYASVPTLLAKAHHRLGIPLEHMEEPQIVRYQPGQEFSWHYDEVPRAQLGNGGQRLATLLVYLNTVQDGGATMFRDLRDSDQQQLKVQPVQGSALLFFPAYRDGRPDDRTLHQGEVAQQEKRIIQMWIHQDSYQAAVPADNTQDKARDPVKKMASSLGYI